MKTLLLLLGAAAFAPGCGHVDRARAAYHEDKAERAAAHGRYHPAAREEDKATELRQRSYDEPLP